MKRFNLLLSLIIFYTSSSCQNSISKDGLANEVLKQVSKKINSLKSISYDIKRELNYSSENYHNETNWTVYFNFKSADTIIGFKYQIENKTAKQVFNGTEEFEIDKKAKTLKINYQPDQISLSNPSAFYNSIITLKNVLPLIISDKTMIKTAVDTTINNTSCYLITLYLNKRRIQNLGTGFDDMTTQYNFIYKIFINKKNDLPFEVLQVNNINNDFIKTSFTNFNTDVQEPAELSWFYSTYSADYRPFAQKEIPQLLSVGSIAPNWILSIYNKNENMSLSQFKGKVILLDFWIKNCGPCIESAPHLNALQEKFRNKKFKILSINAYDLKKDITWFCKKHKINYEVLMNGNSIAEKYGVPGFPSIFLIDKKGKVLYSGGFDKMKIEELIERTL